MRSLWERIQVKVALPTDREALKSDYVYVMYFDGDKIRHMQKIWHAGLALKELGWT
jgi:hypothetical protein